MEIKKIKDIKDPVTGQTVDTQFAEVQTTETPVSYNDTSQLLALKIGEKRQVEAEIAKLQEMLAQMEKLK